MRKVEEVASLPVSHEVDVLVVGGGPAGVAAAFSAARMGAHTMIVEQFNCLGGVATAGGHGHICIYTKWGAPERIVGGIPWEMAERVDKAGVGRNRKHDVDFEVEGMKLVLEQMAEECSCELLYHTFFCDTVVEGGAAVEAVVQNKTGRTRIKAKRIVDCTGDGDVAAQAGCEFQLGDEETGYVQPMTLMFTIGGVDWERVCEFRGKDYNLKHVWAEAQANGDMRPYQSQIMGWWWTPTRPDEVGVNFTHINFVNPLSAEDLTRATVEGRKQAYETIDVYRKYVPGMENCYMVSTPNTVGLRESRRIVGDYMLTREDVVEQARFGDSIGYGSFFIDIHGTEGPGMDTKTWRPDSGFNYQIPFRICLPRGIENLTVAGRCASTTHEALGSIRVMPQCGVMGQAAGVASALSLNAGCTPRELETALLQNELRLQDCIVTDDDVRRVNS